MKISILCLLSVSNGEQCQLFDAPFCRTAGYNHTHLPNRLGQNQVQINEMLSKMKPLTMTDCHKDLSRLLCLFYMPYCPDKGTAESLLPCRELCTEVKSKCQRAIENYQFINWPRTLDCDDLPRYDKNGLTCAGYQSNSDFTNMLPVEDSDPSCSSQELTCPAELKMLASDSPSKYNFLGLDNCGPPCKDHFWSNDDIRLSRKWILGWGIMCLISTLFTVCTYLIDRDRFRYPERPIVFLAACYLIISIVYITGYFMDFEVSCTKNLQQMNANLDYFSTNPTLIVVMGTKNQACTVLFMILYFSTMASSIWWLVLCVSWFLAAVLKWSGEAIENQSQYFHLVAWALPAVATISVLALGRIEGDPLSGICFVGQYDTQSLQIFLMWPQLVFLCIGFIFLMIGYLSMYRIRVQVKSNDPGQHEGIEKLMLKIGIFSSLYLIPASVLLGCYFYLYQYNEVWNNTWLEDHCNYKNSDYGFSCSCDIKKKVAEVGKRSPNFTFFMLKYFMSLIVGVTCGFWIWSDKTLQSWKRFFRCGRKPRSDGMSAPLRPQSSMQSGRQVYSAGQPGAPAHPYQPVNQVPQRAFYTTNYQ